MPKLAICTLTAAEEKLAKLESPLYCATRECKPPAKVSVRVATPEEFTGEVPSDVLPSVKVTVPVGIPAGEASVAVRVADCPGDNELGSTVSATVGVPLLMTCVKLPKLAV